MSKERDKAWKILTDPKEPWCRAIINSFLPEPVGYDWSIETVSEQGDFSGSQLSADRVLVVTKDAQRRKIHLEFQSSTDLTMGRRMLQYGIALGEYSRVSGMASERIVLPEQYIVDVSPRARNATDGKFRVIELVQPMSSGMSVSARFRFQVINYADTIVGKIVKARDYQGRVDATRMLSAVVGSNLLEDANFQDTVDALTIMECAEGSDMSERLWKSEIRYIKPGDPLPPGPANLQEKGVWNSARHLSKKYGIPFEEALRSLLEDSDEATDVTGGDSLGKMHLE